MVHADSDQVIDGLPVEAYSIPQHMVIVFDMNAVHRIDNHRKTSLLLIFARPSTDAGTGFLTFDIGFHLLK